MSDTRDLLTVDYPDGNRIALRIDPISAADRAVVAAHFPPDVDPRHLLLLAAEALHDEAAYRRVCERRGLLPL